MGRHELADAEHQEGHAEPEDRGREGDRRAEGGNKDWGGGTEVSLCYFERLGNALMTEKMNHPLREREVSGGRAFRRAKTYNKKNPTACPNSTLFV